MKKNGLALAENLFSKEIARVADSGDPIRELVVAWMREIDSVEKLRRRLRELEMSGVGCISQLRAPDEVLENAALHTWATAVSELDAVLDYFQSTANQCAAGDASETCGFDKPSLLMMESLESLLRACSNLTDVNVASLSLVYLGWTLLLSRELFTEEKIVVFTQNFMELSATFQRKVIDARTKLFRQIVPQHLTRQAVIHLSDSNKKKLS